MINLLLAFVSSFVLGMLLMPLIISYLKRKQIGQTILGYVENHKEKNGTITMGGVVFILVTLLLAFIFIPYNTNWFIVLLISVFFGLLGFMDDYIKIKYKQNLGLKPYQKIIGQVGLSLILALFIYFFSNIGGGIFLPFSQKEIDIGFFIIPLIMLTLISTSNSVNLTDGLDGLAGNVSVVYLIFFTIITTILSNKLYLNGETGEVLTNINNINILSMLFIGSITAFLLFNTNKASIFMGDVGSLCLGGYIGASACILGLELMLPIIAFCFMFSAISVILQVFWFKVKRKRIFKMAPFHHHLQMSGLSEPKIVFIYNVVTIIVGIFCVIFYLM